MRYSKPTNINQVIENSSFSELMKKGLQVSELNEQLQRLFPAQFKGLYRVASLQQDTLSIEVANAMVRQGLLFQQTQLLEKIQQIQPEIKQLRFYVNPQLIKG